MNHFTPTSSEEALAQEIAKDFNDEDNIKVYLYLCHRYPKGVIWRAFGVARETPLAQIKKSRGALFTYLVKKYANEKTNSKDISH